MSHVLKSSHLALFVSNEVTSIVFETKLLQQVFRSRFSGCESSMDTAIRDNRTMFASEPVRVISLVAISMLG